MNSQGVRGVYSREVYDDEFLKLTQILDWTSTNPISRPILEQ